MRSRDVSAGALARRRVLFILAMSSPKTSPVRRAEIKSSNSPEENKNKMLVSFLCDFFLQFLHLNLEWKVQVVHKIWAHRKSH